MILQSLAIPGRYRDSCVLRGDC